MRIAPARSQALWQRTLAGAGCQRRLTRTTLVDAVATVQPDPACPICGKPILAASLVVYEHGELYHVRCRHREMLVPLSEEIERSRDAQNRARQVQEQAARLIEEAKRRRWPEGR